MTSTMTALPHAQWRLMNLLFKRSIFTARRAAARLAPRTVTATAWAPVNDLVSAV